MVTFVWQIRDKNTGYWAADASGGWYHLVIQDNAWLWRREDLAKKALEKILKKWKDKKMYPEHNTWFKGFVSPEIIGKVDGAEIYTGFIKRLIFI